MTERIQELNELQDKLTKRLQAVEKRIYELEQKASTRKAASSKGVKQPLLGKEKERRIERIDKAAWELEDAIFDQVLPKHEDGSATKYPGDDGEGDIIQARGHQVTLLHANKAYTTAIIFLIILTFCEVPPWCHEKNPNMNIWRFASGAEWCPLPAIPDGKGGVRDNDPNLSGVAYLPPGISFMIEVIIEFFIIRKFWWEYTLDRDHFLPMGEKIQTTLNKVGMFFAIGSICDTAIFMFLRVPFRLTFFFRTGLIFLLPGVQHTFFKIFNREVMTEFGSVAVFMIGTIVFFAWIGVSLFATATDVVYKEGEEKVRANHGFTSLTDAINTMFVGGVTGEFIDCYLPSFIQYRSSGIVWMFYLCLTQVMFKNLVMDTLISAYLKGKEEEDDEKLESQVQGMRAAFALLADGGEEITKDDFLTFIGVLAQSPRWDPVPIEAAGMLYDEFGSLTEDKFCEMCSIIQSKMWITPLGSKALLDDNFQPKPETKWIVDKVWEQPDESGEMQTSDFDNLMNKVLVLNLVMVVIESSYDLMEIPEPDILDLIEIVFSFVYVGEVAVKLSVKSFGEYWSSPANQFDFFTTWLLLSTSALKYLPISALKGDLARYANILRLLRLLRILKQLKDFENVQFMLQTINRIVTEAGDVIALMGTFFFFFSNMAMNMFGGLLYEGNAALEESEYAEKHWYVLNFNDMFMAFMTWFVQILCEYVPNYTDATTRVATAAGLWYGPFSGLVVLFFYITTAAIMYELLLAFTVEVFMAVKDEMYPNKDEEVEREKEEEKEEKAESLEKSSGDGKKSEESSSSSSSSSEGFKPDDFLEKVKDNFKEQGKDLYKIVKCELAFEEEFTEAYEKVLKIHGVGPGGETEYLEEAGSPENICKACWMFENGIYHQEVDLGKVADIQKARSEYLGVLKATQGFYKAIVFLVILTMVEVPAWCHEARGAHLTAFSWAAGDQWCQASSGNGEANFNLSGIWYLPPGYAFVVEVVLEILILRRFVLEYQFEKTHFMSIPGGNVRYSNVANIYCGVIFSVASILDTACFMLFRFPLRWTFVFRTGLLCLLPGVQRLAARIFSKKMLGQFASVAVFFIGTVLFFAWIAVTVYKDSKNISFTLKGEEIAQNKGFESLRASIYTMFLAGMTEGFSDIFIPTVTSHRISAVLWLTFLLLCQVLFLNLVIDAFVAAYLESSEKHTSVTAKTQARAVFHASQVLFKSEQLDKDTFVKFIEEISKSPRMRPMTNEVAEAVYVGFNSDEEAITQESFCDVCSLVQHSIWVAPTDSFLKSAAPGVWESEWFEKVKEAVNEGADEADEEGKFVPKTASFDVIMDWILCANLGYMVFQSEFMEDSTTWTAWFLEFFFTMIYVLEVGVKLSVKSLSTYWSQGSNQFDFFTTWLLFCTWILKYVPIQALQTDLVKYANIIRLFRLLRVVKKLNKDKNVRFMVNTIIRMVEAAGDILGLLGVCLFFFTTFSVNFFGGLLYDGNPKLEGTDFEEKHWFIFNFNDVIMAFSTWFTQLLCEYAPEWADALWRVSRFGDVAWCIYPVFYLIGVAIVFEILKAFTIETYLALKEEADGEEGEEESSSDEEDEEESLQDKAIRAVTEKMKKENKSLHYKKSLLPDFQKQLTQAFNEALNPEEEEGEKKEEKEEKKEEE